MQKRHLVGASQDLRLGSFTQREAQRLHLQVRGDHLGTAERGGTIWGAKHCRHV